MKQKVINFIDEVLNFTNQYFFIRQAMCGNPQKKLFSFS